LRNILARVTWMVPRTRNCKKMKTFFVTDEGAIPHYRRQATGGMSHRMLTSVCSDDSDGLEVRKLRSGVQSWRIRRNSENSNFGKIKECQYGGHEVVDGEGRGRIVCRFGEGSEAVSVRKRQTKPKRENMREQY